MPTSLTEQRVAALGLQVLLIKEIVAALVATHPEPLELAAAIERQREEFIAMAGPTAIDEQSLATVVANLDDAIALLRGR